jgi:archaetidylinositol phosphate synthase
MGKQLSDRRETRIQASLLAGMEKRCLIWMARRLPDAVGSDHLTVLGGVAMLGAGLCYWIGSRHPAALLLVVVFLAINWFGDSLDGTLARVREQERPRYGFYVDHVLDVLGMLFLFAGLCAGGFMTPIIGASFLLAYYLLTVEIALATHAVGTFRISYWKMGPTELRILLAAGTLQLLRSPYVGLLGDQYLLFDVGGVVAIAGLLSTFAASAISNTITLYRREPLPPRGSNGQSPIRNSIDNRQSNRQSAIKSAVQKSATAFAKATAVRRSF